jgi:phospholipase A1
MTHMTSPNQAPYEVLNQGDLLTHNELKFQLSLRAKFAKGLFGNAGGDLWLAYSQTSWWQAFNRSHSSPFRETNYEPEGWLSFYTDSRVLGFRLREMSAGFVHQSNGQAGSLSRSWNRVYGEAQLVRDNWRVNLKPWLRIPESAAADNNPDITSYLGHFETRVFYQTDGKQLFSLMVRNVFNRDHRLNAEADWTFPIAGKVRGMLQYYYGYGESLIDYNYRINRLGIGIALTDWI